MGFHQGEMARIFPFLALLLSFGIHSSCANLGGPSMSQPTQLVLNLLEATELDLVLIVDRAHRAEIGYGTTNELTKNCKDRLLGTLLVQLLRAFCNCFRALAAAISSVGRSFTLLSADDLSSALPRPDCDDPSRLHGEYHLERESKLFFLWPGGMEATRSMLEALADTVTYCSDRIRTGDASSTSGSGRC